MTIKMDYRQLPRAVCRYFYYYYRAFAMTSRRAPRLMTAMMAFIRRLLCGRAFLLIYSTQRRAIEQPRADEPDTKPTRQADDTCHARRSSSPAANILSTHAARLAGMRRQGLSRSLSR